MNRKQLIILIVVAVVVGGAGLLVSKKRSKSWETRDSSERQKLVASFPINDVAHIRIQQATGEVNLVVQDDLWRVKERWGYPANFETIREFVQKVPELKPVQSVKVGPTQFGRLELLTPDEGTNSGTVVELKDKSGKAITSLLLGKKHVRQSQDDSPMGGGDFPTGRYVVSMDHPKQVWLVSETFNEIEPKPENWLNKDFFKVEKLKAVSLASTNAMNSWKVARETETGTWALVDKKEGEEGDSGKMSGVGYVLSSPNFNDVVSPDSKPEELGLDKPLAATLETFDGFTYAVKLAKKDDDNFYLRMNVEGTFQRERTPGAEEKPEDKEKLDKEFKEKLQKLEEKLKNEKAYEKWTYLVSKWTVDPLLKERKDLLAEKKPDTAAPAQNGDAPLSVQPQAPGAQFRNPDAKVELPPVLPPLPGEPKKQPDNAVELPKPEQPKP